MSTTVHHVVDKRFMGIDPDGVRVMIDGERDIRTGLRPMQLVLNALGACAAYDIVEMIGKRKLEIRSYRIELEGERQDGTPSPFTKIRTRHYFDVPGLEMAQAQRFVDLGMNKYCSVGASLNAELEFEVILEHEAQPAAGATG